MVPRVAGSNPVDRPLSYFCNATAERHDTSRRNYSRYSSRTHRIPPGKLLGAPSDRPTPPRLENTWRDISFSIWHVILGTLLAIAFVFYQPLREVIQSNTIRRWQIALAIAPLFPLALFLKPIKAMYADPSYLGYFFLCTSAILFIGCWIGARMAQVRREPAPLRDAAVIGLWQAAAIFPGLSRSGATISGARLLGWEPREAVIFSFMIAIPYRFRRHRFRDV